jgi:hypothetical protein
MAELDLFSGQIRGQLELPHEITDLFRLPDYAQPARMTAVRFDWHTATILPTYHADGRRAPKYKAVHWHDWMREHTRPWRRPADRDLASLLKQLPDGVAYEQLPESAV